MPHTLQHKCDDCGALIAERTISQESMGRIYGRIDQNPEGYTVKFGKDGNTIIKWAMCTPCYQYEMAGDVPL